MNLIGFFRVDRIAFSRSLSTTSSIIEKDWPPLEECVQYKYCIIRQYLQKFEWESDERDETFYVRYSSPEDEDEYIAPRTFAFKPSSLKKFVEIARTSRGYDMDVVGEPVPGFMRSPFNVYKKKTIEEYLNYAVELAINHINSKTVKVYKHVDTLKVIDTCHRLLLLTFTAQETTVKEVEMEKEFAAKTFLAAIYAPAACPETFQLEECFLKPEGPAPWKYVELNDQSFDMQSLALGD
ncbi:hypothetical protein ACS0TY_012764 [Phlomoides rotata]